MCCCYLVYVSIHWWAAIADIVEHLIFFVWDDMDCDMVGGWLRGGGWGGCSGEGVERLGR